MDLTYYKIKDVIPKSGSLRYVHFEVLGRDCVFDEDKYKPGDRAYIMYDAECDPSRLHRLHTSRVRSITKSDDEKKLVIETNNTYYVLEKGEDRNVAELLYSRYPSVPC